MASLFNGNWLRWIFMGYVFITILDCYYRPGFIVTQGKSNTMVKTVNSLKGHYWLGCSTFRCWRKCNDGSFITAAGSSMAEAAAIANILTLPLSLTATLTYCVLSLWQSTWTPNGFIGLIWFEAAFILGCWNMDRTIFFRKIYFKTT